MNSPDRIYTHASMILDNMTIREVAKRTGFSKSTVHTDIRKRLPKINKSMSNAVSEKLEYNFSTKHLRGGEATKKKYSKKIS